MSEQLLDLLKLCLLVLLYLFFLRVMWAVFSELRAPTAAPQGAATPAPSGPAASAEPKRRGGTRPSPKKASGRSRRTPTALSVVEPVTDAGAEYALTAEMTIGRAPGCSIVVDDTYASQLHARLYLDNGAPFLEDLGSTNGTFCNGEAVTGPRQLRRADRIQIGNCVWEVT